MGGTLVALAAVALAPVGAAGKPIAHPAVYQATVPLRFTKSGLPVVEGRAGGVTVWLLLDTGAANSTFRLGSAKRLGMKPTDMYRQTAVADGRKLDVRFHSLGDLSIGGCALQKGLFGVMDMPDLSTAAGNLGLELDGLLGGEVLRRLNAVVDYDRRELRVKPDWADDLCRMQGTWVAVDYEGDRGPLRAAARPKLRRVRLVVAGERMRLDMSGIGSVVLDHRLELRVNFSPRRWVSSDVWVDGSRVPGENVGEAGLYEFNGGRLKLLLPSDKPIHDVDLPAKLTASVPNSGLMLFTFERVPPALGGWPDLFVGLLVRGAAADSPVRFGGWEFAVTRDWTLTGVNAAQKLRFTARLDGSVTVQPVRP